jgi:hypothetical protein
VSAVLQGSSLDPLTTMTAGTGDEDQVVAGGIDD